MNSEMFTNICRELLKIENMFENRITSSDFRGLRGTLSEMTLPGIVKGAFLYPETAVSLPMLEL